MSDIKQTLSERGNNYGSFETQANLSRHLKSVVTQHYYQTHTTNGKPEPIDNDIAEALDMILHKIARIVNGNPRYIDSWRDIVGFSQLVIDRLAITDGATDTETNQVIRKQGEWQPINKPLTEVSND